MADLIVQGLVLEMAASKLQEHLLARSAYHAARRDHHLAEYKRTAEANIAGEEAMDADEGFTNTNSYGGQTALQYAKQHRTKAAYFKFLAENLIPGAVYRLGEKDIANFEMGSF